MSGLGVSAAVLGALCAVMGGLCVTAPARMHALLVAFPRQRVAGWLLTSVVLVWCGRLLYAGPLGFLEPYRGLLFFLVPAAVVLVVVFVDELLAARALGGLLILVPTPLLEVARWHPSAARYVVIALAYAMVISGAVLVTIPYAFRKACERVAPDAPSCQRLGGGVLLLAVALAVVVVLAR
ncbi:MAG: hypothetical protein K8T26_12705 [Lentisphaerae bacterium]|nr:hypothetical protein [Lentisphaerota bacterium]